MTEMSATIQQLAEAAGVTHARVRSSTGLLAEEEVRQSCLVNYCGKSGKSWTCPPYAGELAVLEARLLTYSHSLVLQSITTLEDSWDFEGMTEAAHTHNNSVRKILAQLVELCPDSEFIAFGCGSCDQCEVCSCPDEPCRFPELAMSSVEAQGLDINALVTSVGLSYINGADTVSYVGMVLWK